MAGEGSTSSATNGVIAGWRRMARSFFSPSTLARRSVSVAR
jgi:hypothetical protein